MRISYVPMLGTLRELSVQPRDVQRFGRYLAALTGGTDDIVLPIGVANPMAKEHAVAKIDELLALGAEDVGARAAAEAAARLVSWVPLEVEGKASRVLVDDVGDGWTNRYTTEASVRFPGRGALDQRDVEDALYAAAERNGLVADDGQRACWATVRSGLGAGLQQPVDLGADDRPPAQKHRRATRGSSRSR